MSLKPYYDHAGITIYHGDCLKVMPKLNKIKMLLTDPPYTTPVISAYGRKREKHYGDISVQKGFFTFFKQKLEPILCEQAPVFICCDYKYFPVLFEVFYEWPTSQLLIWDKMKIGLGSPFRHQYEMVYFCSKDYGLHFRNDRWLSDILKHKPVNSKKKFHGAEKPISLFKELIDVFDSSVVLDPFMGSGTTLVAARKLGRKAIGIEIEEKYCEIAVRRLAQEVLPLNMGSNSGSNSDAEHAKITT